MNSASTVLKIFLLLTVIFITPLPALSASPYTLNTLFLTVYGDGNTLVEYNLAVDPTLPRVTVPLFSQIYSDMLITSNQSEPLDYQVMNGSIVIDTLGASGVDIIYTTPDLINKDGAVWTVSINSPISFSIRFPNEATIISMSSIPLSITTADNQYILTMKPGLQSASYSTSIVGTKEQAAIAIKNAELAIQQARASAVSTPEADNWLARAKSAYNQGQYSESEQSAVQASRLVEQAMIKITTTTTTTPTTTSTSTSTSTTITTTTNTTSSANPIVTTQTTSASTPTPQSNDVLLLAPGLIAAAAMAVLLIVLFRRRVGSRFAYEKEVRHVDAEALLRSRPQLRLEDREALQYLADSGGEAFETELREKFQLPKTTIWRQVRRLQREGLVEVRKIGGQNLIRIREDIGGR